MLNVQLQRQKKRILVNADDYGFFHCVSQGILDSHRRGVVTATGIMSNGPNFEPAVSELRQLPNLDAGVHLNLTQGRPITTSFNEILRKRDGNFLTKMETALAIVAGRIKRKSVEEEWRAQIERCLAERIELYFLNSHEHIHMLPMLFQTTIALANEYNIPFVRVSQPEWVGRLTLAGFVRNTTFLFLNTINSVPLHVKGVQLIGMSESGRLSLEYCKTRFRSLAKTSTYELMCHPGYYDSSEVSDRSLLRYHDWEAEYQLLTSRELKRLCTQYEIEIVRYADIV